MYDRALQALVKLGRSPEWEARFEPNSYGFWPGQSTQDAIEAILFKDFKVMGINSPMMLTGLIGVREPMNIQG